MNWEAAVSGCSLAMDAFAASVCIGASSLALPWRTGCRLGLACGLFQFFMPLLGWVLGDYSARWAAELGPWLAFGLLTFVGGSTALGALGGGRNDLEAAASLPTSLLLPLALATSIDALVVGAGFALANLPVLELAGIAGGVTALVCVLGVGVGRFFGARFGRGAEFLGGAVLVLIGLHFLAAHLLGE